MNDCLNEMLLIPAIASEEAHCIACEFLEPDACVVALEKERGER